MNGRIDALTSIRFFAAIFVLSSHLAFLENTNYSYLFVKDGFIGVTLFFILSGFVLSYSYENKFKQKQVKYKDFILYRIFRIYPIHVFTLFLALPMCLNLKGLVTFFPNLLLVQSFIPNSLFYFSWNAPSWSISNEMFFYVLFPFLVLFQKKHLLIAYLFLIALQLIILFSVNNHAIKHATLYISPFLRVSDFILGILIYQIYSDRKDYLQSKSSFLQFVSVIVFSIFIFVANTLNIDEYYKYSIYYVFPMALIILSFSLNNGFLSKVFSNRVLIFLGECSFSLYMIHQLVIRYFLHLNSKFGFMNDLILTITIIFTSIILSMVLYIYFEKPIQRILVKKYKDRLSSKKI